MSELLEKTTESCGNIFLLDERLCLSDSFSLINSNSIALSSKINELYAIANEFNSLYTYFTQNSSNWNLGATNANEYGPTYNRTYTTISKTSAIWAKEFAVTYPYILEINDWNINYLDYKVEIKNWLMVNFPPSDYSTNQQAYVYLNLYQTDTFTFNFSGNYRERCYISTPPFEVCCRGSSCGDLQAACNVHEGKGKNRVDRCFNPYTQCRKSYQDACATGTCGSSGQKLLQLLYVTSSYSDTYTARCVLLKFKKIGNTQDWVEY